MSFNFMGGNDPTPTYNAFGEIVFEFGFPNNLSSMNFMPSKTSNGLRARNSDGPDDDTSSKDDATEGNDANDANASTSEDLGYDISLKEDLNKAFKVIKAPGSFAAWEALPTIPPAGLNVEGVGDIAFPLQEQTVRQLIAKSHQAPYGRRSETLVDVSVRNTWEINRDHLQFFDPAWQRYLVDLGDLVATKLGIDGPIRLELYKLLIYEKGAMFKAHTDTEKTPGMFGTLVICLPSAHTGGEVIVTHNGVTKTLKTSDAPQSFACWYSDVMHQVLPVKSGYQCILTYNLAIKPGLTPPTATASNYQKENIRKTLQVWLKQLGNRGVESHLYCALQHEYTEAAMSLQALKTDDLIRAQVMHDLTSELPFEIFLALLEKKAEGFPEEEDYNPRKRCRYSYDDYGEDEDDDDDEEEDYHSRSRTKGGFHIMTDIMDTSYAVKSLHALDGTRIARDYRFDMKSCLEEDPFLDRQVAEEDYESYTGNEGPAATHWYRRATLVIVPHRKLRHYLARCKSYKSVTNNNTKSVIAYLAKVCSLPTARKPMLDAMKKLFGEQSLAGLPTGTISDILKAALQHSDFQLFKDTAGCHRGQLSDTFLDWVKEWLDAHPTAELSEKCQNWIPILLSGCQTFSDRINILRKISRTDGDGQTTSTPWAQDLIRQFINNFVETSGMYPGEDAKVMVSAVFNLNEQWAVKSAFLASIFDRFQTLSLGGLSSETIHHILKAALQHSDYQLFKSTTGSHHGYMPDTFFDWVKEWLDTLPESDLLEKCQNWIPLLLSGYSSLNDRMDIVRKITRPNGDVEHASPPWAQHLIRQSINNFIGTIGMPTSEDGRVIVNAVFNLNDSWADTSVFLTSIFDRFPQAQAAAFSLAFLKHLKFLATHKQFPVSDILEVWRSLSSRFFTQKRTPGNIVTSAYTNRRLMVTSQDLVDFASDLNANAANLLEPFIQQITAHCTQFSADDMRSFWMPFFYDLTRALAYRSALLNTASYKQLTLQLIQRLDGQVLGPCPQAGVSSRRPQVACPCDDCGNLNRFLRDSSQTIIRFKLVQARRQHLEKTLKRHNIACTQTTERTGSPQTLVITKTYTLQDEINEWKKQQKKFYASLNQNIQPEHLRNIIGDEEFALIRSLAGGQVLATSNRHFIDLT